MSHFSKVKVGTVVFGTFAIALTVWSIAQSQEAKAAPERKVFKNSVVAIPPHLSLNAEPTTDEHKDDTMQLLFSLELPQELQKDLEQRIAKGEVLTATDMERYSIPKETYQKLESWLKDQGFKISRTSKDRTSVYVKGTVKQIEKSLDVKMVRITSEGVTYNATETPPSLPIDVGQKVNAIIGLQPFLHATKHAIRFDLPHENQPATAVVALTAPVQVPKAKPRGYLVADVLRAYNADNLQFTGAGEKIAILIDKFPNDDDLTEFWNVNNLPNTLTSVEKLNVNNGTVSPPDGEETMDVEWAGGIARGATVRVYAAGSLFLTDLDAAVDQIIDDLSTQPAIHQLSISMGLAEKDMPEDELKVEHLQVAKLVAQGVNVFVSSGDDGSRPRSSAGHIAQVEYQSSDPLVVAVGGTTLVLDSNGTVKSETAWKGSGGGASGLWPKPTYQTGSPALTGQWRLVPDISLVADPNTGAFVYLLGTNQQIGGTSLSAPVWAGFCAIINEARRNAGKGPLHQLHPVIYPLIGTSSFRDITSGNNGDYTAGSGYDKVTGLGSPNVKELLKALTH
jgi:kumamolisin